MTSITIAVTDREHPVPGFAVEAIRDLCCMHDPAVQEWVTAHRMAAAFVVVADPEWVIPDDGTESLAVLVSEQDAAAVAAIWAKLKASPRLKDEDDG
jgi:hypothetical protein